MATLALLAALATTAINEPRIFDGKTLTGWTVVGGGKWEVLPGGILRGSCTKTDPQGLLVWDKTVKDFDARLQFRISSGNSGFYFRTERIDRQPLVRGYQAEIDALPDVGGIWETDGRGWIVKPDDVVHKTTRFQPGKWTDLRVWVRDNHYKVWINGAMTADVIDANARKQGAVALQLHGDIDMTVEFRNIRLAQR